MTSDERYNEDLRECDECHRLVSTNDLCEVVIRKLHTERIPFGTRHDSDLLLSALMCSECVNGIFNDWNKKVKE